ncbi:MAG: phage holin family protein [Cyclobacteriaceae bacterium]
MAKIFNVDRLIETVTDYAKVRIDLLKVDLIERISGLAALIITFLVIFMLGLFLMAFASLTLGSFLNEVLESSYLGYLIVTVFYVIILTVVVIILKSGKLQAFLETIVAESMQTSEEDEQE